MHQQIFGSRRPLDRSIKSIEPICLRWHILPRKSVKVGLHKWASEWLGPCLSEWVSEFVLYMTMYGHLYMTWSGHAPDVTRVWRRTCSDARAEPHIKNARVEGAKHRPLQNCQIATQAPRNKDSREGETCTTFTDNLVTASSLLAFLQRKKQETLSRAWVVWLVSFPSYKIVSEIFPEGVWEMKPTCVHKSEWEGVQ